MIYKRSILRETMEDQRKQLHDQMEQLSAKVAKKAQTNNVRTRFMAADKQYQQAKQNKDQPAMYDSLDSMKSLVNILKYDSLQEAPLDFVRGAAGEVGQKIAGSAPVRAVKDVVAAGKTASRQAEFAKKIQQFAALIDQRITLQQSLGQGPNTPTKAQQAAPAQAPQAQQQQAEPQTAVPSAFRAETKPKMRPGKYGPEFTFDSFMRELHGQEQLSEGVLDFIKGAGAAVGDKIRSAINDYGNRPSILKDIYAAGKSASQAGDLRKMQQQYKQVDAQARSMLTDLRNELAQMGEQGQAVLRQAIAKMNPTTQQRVIKLLTNTVQR